MFEATLSFIKTRYPQQSELLAVLGVSLFVCHGWSVRGFFDELSSFLLYYQLIEIFAIFSYMVAFAMIESLIVVGGLVLLAILLPSKWLKEGFSYKGLVFIAVSAFAALDFQKKLGNVYPSTEMLMLGFFVPLAIIIVLMFMAAKLSVVQKILLDAADRFSIMVYIFIPIGIISLGVVVFRNLF